MKFQFKLQTVLDVKEKWLKQTTDEIYKLQIKLNEQEKIIQNVISEIEKCENDINNEDQFSPEQISLMYEYYYDLTKRLDFEKIRKNEIEEEIEEKRRKLVQQSREIKVLEKLKEKEFEEFKKQIESEQQKFLDELAVIQNKKAI
jgi:flagellar FliJ protein